MTNSWNLKRQHYLLYTHCAVFVDENLNDLLQMLDVVVTATEKRMLLIIRKALQIAIFEIWFNRKIDNSIL